MPNSTAKIIVPKKKLICPKCFKTPETSDNKKSIYLSYFGKDIKKICCEMPLPNWLETYFLKTNFSPFFDHGNIFITSSLCLEITLEPYSPFTLNLTSYGIPENATIVYINLTPQLSSLFPTIMKGNDLYPNEDIPREITIFPYQPTPKKTGKSTKLACAVRWTKHSNPEKNYLWKQLVTAINYCRMEKYNDAIIPLNIAVEASLKNLLENEVVTPGYEELITRTNYEYCLNNSLKLVVKKHDKTNEGKVKRFSKILTDLLQLRNKLAHGKKPENQPTKENLAKYVTNALIAINYFEYLENMIPLKRNSSDQK